MVYFVLVCALVGALHSYAIAFGFKGKSEQASFKDAVFAFWVYLFFGFLMILSAWITHG